MAKIKRRYTKEEKLQIVLKSLEEGESVQEVAAIFEINPNTLYNWRSAYLKDKENAFPGKGKQNLSESEREIRELKRQLREAQLERDILKKAVGIFSKRDGKFSNL